MITEAFRRGFMDKLAEYGGFDTSLSFVTPWVTGKQDTVKRDAQPVTSSADGVVVPEYGTKLEHVKKPTWIQRNPWVFKPIVNALNIRYGSGAPVTGFKFSF